MNQLTFNHSYQSDSFDPGSNTGFSGSRGQLYNNGQAFAYPGQQHNGNGGQLSFHSPAVGQFEDNTRVNQSAYGGQEIRTSVPAQTPISQLPRTSSGRQTASPRPIAPQQSYQQHAMAVPAQPSQSPGNMISAQPATPNTPTTPNSTSNLESSRISLIISINQELLQEINRLQSIGQGGAVNPQQAAQQTAQTGQEPKMASEEYIQLLRRAQGNLAWLMGRANGASAANGGDVPGGGKMLPGPAYMQHPSQMPALSGKYEELRRLFPDWPGNDAKMMAMVGNGGGSGTGSPAVGSGNAAVVQGQQQAGINGTTTMANMSSGRKRTTKTAKLSEKQLQATSSAATIAAKSQDRKPRGGAKASKDKVQKSKPTKAKATEQKPLHMLRIENPHEHRARKLRPSRLRFDWSEDTENEPQSMRRASI